MEPKESELSGLVESGALAVWCGIADGSDLRLALFAALGCSNTDNVRFIARMAEADFRAVVNNIKLNTGTSSAPVQSPLTPLQTSQCGLFWETSQFVAGTKKLAEVLKA